MLRRLFARVDDPPPGYYAPRFAHARHLGEDAARSLSLDWPEAERMLQGIWRQDAGGVAWAEAGPVIHYAWRLTREAMHKKNPA